MKKIGLVTCYFKKNYGSKLQAYALQNFLENNNIPCENIDIKYLKDFKKGKKKFYLSQLFNFKFIFSKMGMLLLKIKRKLIKNDFSKNLNIRDKKFNYFDENFKFSKRYVSYSQINEECKERYTDVIVGSDQLWLPVNVVADYYTLNCIPKDVNKISYSTSLGISYIPNKYKKLYETFLTRINHLSVREDKAVEIIKDNFGLDAKCVCDPTMLLSKEEWIKKIDSISKYNEKYVLCYFLGKNIEHRKFVERLAKEKKLKIVSINHCDEYVKYSDKFADYIPYDIGPFEWINLINNSEYVCTDSFHGTVFSIIFNKKFFTFSRYSDKQKVSTNSRIVSLLSKFNLKTRHLNGKEDIEKVDNEINYDSVNITLNEYRNESKKFLLNSIKYKEEKIMTVADLQKIDCCGCSACEQKCPTKAIIMKEDIEGFLYPCIDEEKCINCGLCTRVCRSINPIKEEKKEQYGYIVQHKDENILKESTSGGAFTAFATQIIKEGGVVFGATLENKRVYHVAVDNINDLSKFRSSKYAQSDINHSFVFVEKYLNEDRKVLFSGTACQIEGLLSYLSKEYDNLYLVDVVCRAVPSPLVLRKYLEYNEGKYGENLKIRFRDKTLYGYNYSNLSLKKDDKILYHKGAEEDYYLRLFLKGFCNRPTCASCKYKKRYRESDITIWDCFDVVRFDKNFDNNKGCTKVLIHSNKGKSLFNDASNDLFFKYITPEYLIEDSLELTKSTPDNILRNDFMKEVLLVDFKTVANKYLGSSVMPKMIYAIKKILVKLNLYSILKNIKIKINK